MNRKKSWFSRMLSILLAMCLMFASPLSAMAADDGTSDSSAAATVATGVSGDVTLTLDSDGVLTLSVTEAGTAGETADSSSGSGLPTEIASYQADIKTVVVEDGVTKLGSRLFYNCSSLTTVDLSKNTTLTTLGDCVFQKCSSLTSIVLPASVTTIGFACFLDCKAMESADLSACQVTALENRTFTNCTAITSISIPESVAAFNYDTSGSNNRSAFYKCGSDGNTTIYYAGTEAQWAALMACTDPDNSVCAANLETYQIKVVCSDTNTGDDSGEGNTDESSVVASGTTSDVDWVLTSDYVLTLTAQAGGNGTTADYTTSSKAPWSSYVASITKVVVEEGVVYLGDRLFKDCSSLTAENIQIASTVTTYGASLFQNCSALTSYTVPTTVTTIGNACFYNCTALTSVEILGSITVLEHRMFTNCSSLAEIKLPASIASFTYHTGNQSAFRACGPKDGSTKVYFAGTEAEWVAVMATDTNGYCATDLTDSVITVICSDTVVDDGSDSGSEEEGSGSDDEQGGTTDPNVLASGTTGTVDWSLSTDGVMTLSAQSGTTGVTDNYANKTSAPWYEYMDNIVKVVIEEGVTVLGERLFYGADSLTEVVFPATSLTTISEGAFRECTALETITLPSSLTTLGRAQFYNSTNLKEVIINGSITYLDELVVGGCGNLTTITIPGTVTNLSGTGNKNTFYNCYGLTTINFGGTVNEWKLVLARGNSDTVMDSNITVYCTDGTYNYDPNETLPDPSEGEDEDATIVSGTTGALTWTLDRTTGVFTLSGTGASANYSSTTTGVNGSVNGATPWADYMDEITKVVVEEGVTTLGNRLFYGADILTEVVFPESSLTTIGNGTFRLCNSLEEITLPDSLTTLTRVAFYSCANLKKVVLGTENSKLTTLNDQTFYLCSNLTEITIPASMTTFNFNSTKGPLTGTPLTDIYYSGTIAQWEAFLAGTNSSDVKKGSITVHCSDGIYIDGDIGNGIVYTLNNGVLTLEARLDTGDMLDFADVSSVPWAADAATIVKVVIKNSITRIGANAFAECTNIANVVYEGSEEGWTSIEERSGENNDPLFNANITYLSEGKCGDSVYFTYDADTKCLTIYGEGEVYDYASGTQTPWGVIREEIATVIVEEGVTYLGDYLFNKAYSLTSVTLPEGLREIGTATFANCTGLTSITFPEGLEVIGSKSFTGGSNLAEVYLPSTIKYIDMKAFENASGIKDVYYNGTQGEWDQVIISESALGNSTLLNATLHLLKTADTFTDVEAGTVYAEAVEYLTDYGYLTVKSETFGVDDAADMDMVLAVLYARAGEPAMYDSTWEWAVSNGLVTSGVNGEVSLEQLAYTLYRAAVLNGTADENSEVSALEWCTAQGYFGGLTDSTDTERALTRGEVALVLTGYLLDDASYANHYDEQAEIIKNAIANGGDGKMYIYVLNTTTEGASSKPGDSTLIVFPDGQTMLIDTAISTSKENVLNALKAIEIVDLDYLVISHPHSDHVGNAVAVVQYLKSIGGSVGTFYRGEYDYNNYILKIEEALGDATPVVTLEDGDVLEISGVTINVYNPTAEQVAELNASGDTGDENQNAISLAMKFTYGTSTFLTCGDLYVAQENILIDKYGSVLQADVMKTNHHGAYTSNCEEWMDTVDPAIAFVESDDIGSTPLYEMCTEKGIAFYSFGLDGAILISMDNAKNYEVITQYDSVLRSNYTGEVGKAEGVIGQSEIVIEPVDTLTEGDADIALEVSGGADELSYQYSSSDESVVTVDENGNVHIVGPGTAVITVTKAHEYYQTVSAEVTITVNKAAESETESPTEPPAENDPETETEGTGPETQNPSDNTGSSEGAESGSDNAESGSDSGVQSPDSGDHQSSAMPFGLAMSAMVLAAAAVLKKKYYA